LSAEITHPELFRSGYVALVGAPNAGKSTLMNQLVRQKLAIVSPKPQTTRRRTLGIVSGEDFQMILLDTPGILEPKYALQRAMMHTVTAVLADADVACLLIDLERGGTDQVSVPEVLRSFDGARVAVLNKVDTIRNKDRLIPMIDTIHKMDLFGAIVPLSALTGEGVDRLIPVLIEHLPQAPPLYPVEQLTEQPERFFVAELIRERVFFLFQEEIPYSIEVEIVEFKERPGAKDFIEAVLYVEHPSQKGIVIGKSGRTIRQLGEEAREAIEGLLERPVYLELRVKVAQKWRKNEAALRRLGFRI
jgi:GTP-binding protein Era